MVNATALASLPLFKGLTSVELEELASYLVDRHASAQERIIEEGDAAGHPIYLLLTGTVDVLKRGHHSRPHVIGSLAAPSVFGEVEVLARRPAIASVVASTDCELALLQRGVFDELAAANRSAILKVIKNLAATLSFRLAATDERLAAFFGVLEKPEAAELRQAIFTGWKTF